MLANVSLAGMAITAVGLVHHLHMERGVSWRARASMEPCVTQQMALAFVSQDTLVSTVNSNVLQAGMGETVQITALVKMELSVLILQDIVHVHQAGLDSTVIFHVHMGVTEIFVKKNVTARMTLHVIQ